MVRWIVCAGSDPWTLRFFEETGHVPPLSWFGHFQHLALTDPSDILAGRCRAMLASAIRHFRTDDAKPDLQLK